MEVSTEDLIKDLAPSDDDSNPSEDDGEQNHSKLLKSLSVLGGKKRSKNAERTEASTVVSEFHLSESIGKVKVHELLKSLSSSTKNVLSKKQLQAAGRKTRILDVPLPKIQSEKFKRTAAYGKVSKDIAKWDSVVDKNRMAECMDFPLNQPSFRLEPTSSYVKRFQLKTPLEMEVSRLLKGCDDVVQPEQALSPAEERALKAMNLDEARVHLQELQKMRALLTYQESRARRQNKIKSKRYHRILKKDRLKKQLAEFEELKKTNPELALEKLQDLDKRRIEERLTLKHKSTGKWAKQNILRSKYDKTSRDALSDQLQLNRQLTQKVNPKFSEDEIESEEEANSEVAQPITLPTEYNAWLKPPVSESLSIETAPETSQTETNPKLNVVKLSMKRKKVTLIEKSSLPVLGLQNAVLKWPSKEAGPKTIQAETNPKPNGVKPNVFKRNAKQKKVTFTEKSSALVLDSKSEPPISEAEELEHMDESIAPLPTEYIPEADVDLSISEEMNTTENNGKDIVREKRSKAVNIEVDPGKFIGARPKKLLSSVPVLMDSGDEDLDDTNGTLLTMKEAFADDDVLEEFKTAKEDAVNANKPKDLDLMLPGWGDWAGAGVAPPSNRKRKRFIVRAVAAAPRKDRTIANVIINEEKEVAISNHMVSELPFPFKNVHQFETSIGHPLGSTWNPQSSFQDLVHPSVITKRGQIIHPMNADALLKNKPSKHKPSKISKPINSKL